MTINSERIEVGDIVAYRRSNRLVTEVKGPYLTVEIPAVGAAPINVAASQVTLTVKAGTGSADRFAATVAEARRLTAEGPNPPKQGSRPSKAWLRAHPELVPPCPTCKARSGFRCRTASGADASKVHVARTFGQPRGVGR